jgi:Protein of unknown function (DUF2505)
VPQSFDILTESPASVEQVHAAFSREDYWLARHAAFDVTSTLDSLIVEADGTVTVRATQHLGRQLLPGLLAKLVPGDLKILHSETWRPVGDRRVRGQVSISAPAALGSGRAEAWLAPVDPVGKGSRLRFAATVEVKIPLVGGKLENSIGADLAENIPAIQRFTTAWITEHA